MRLKSNKVPHGQDILNPEWPDAKWDVGGLFVHDDNIFQLLDNIKQRYDCVLPITSVFGCYNVRWQGGRTACTSPTAIDHISAHLSCSQYSIIPVGNKPGIIGRINAHKLY